MIECIELYLYGRLRRKAVDDNVYHMHLFCNLYQFAQATATCKHRVLTVQLLGFLTVIGRQIDVSGYPGSDYYHQAPEFQRAIQMAQKELGDLLFAEAWNTGSAMSIEQVLKQLLEVQFQQPRRLRRKVMRENQ
ncbi:MAG TPA: hypothetical protein VKU00_11605 [Chthonomonadaceae bacterium]|nr:hypothetical protein [Chthonomonadaceae bacterium]